MRKRWSNARIHMSQMHDKDNSGGRKKNTVIILQELHENKTVKYVKADTKAQIRTRGRCIYFCSRKERVRSMPVEK